MRNCNQKLRRTFSAPAFLAIAFWGTAVCAQTTSFTYQGKLTDGGTPANGSYDLQFALWDSASGGSQIGSTQTLNSVAVSNGIFTVTLDFGTSAFPGANRFLEIGVRPTGGGAFTILSPRVQITSTPYAIRSLGSTSADGLSSACTGCVQNSNISSVAGSKVNGTIAVANGGTGATSLTANAPLIGNGGGAVSAGSRSGNTTTFATTSGVLASSHCVQIDSNGNLVDSGAGCGGGSGGGLPDPGNNGLLVRTATNTTAARSLAAGSPLTITNPDGTTGNPTINLTGVVPAANGGTGLGSSGASGNFLKSDGSTWTSAALSSADLPSGSGSYIQNTTSTQAGSNFKIDGNGTAGGTLSGNVVNSATLYNLGGNRILSAPGTNNLFAGLNAGQANTSGASNVFAGAGAGQANTIGVRNSFFGFNTGRNNVGDAFGNGSDNCFFGSSAGANNTGQQNAFFGSGAGAGNTSGSFNSFFGEAAGVTSATGSNNTLVGSNADVTADGLVNSSAIGFNAKVDCSHCMVLGDVSDSSLRVGIGTSNPYLAKLEVEGGNGSGVFGRISGSFGGSGVYGYSDGSVGDMAVRGFGTSFFQGDTTPLAGLGKGVAIGYGSAGYVFAFDTNYSTPQNLLLNHPGGNVGIGTTSPQDTLDVNGNIRIGLGAGGNQQMCWGTVSRQVATCGSSLRYKSNVSSFPGGLEIIKRLRPISFTWKQGGARDLGLAAEEVEKVEPLLTFRNDQGQIEGVKYNQLSALFINAIKEQQKEIEQLKEQVRQLRANFGVRQPRRRFGLSQNAKQLR